MKKKFGGAQEGAGRPPSKDKRIPKSIRFTQSEVQKAQKGADKEGLSFSAWCIKKIFGS